MSGHRGTRVPGGEGRTFVGHGRIQRTFDNVAAALCAANEESTGVSISLFAGLGNATDVIFEAFKRRISEEIGVQDYILDFMGGSF